jgi:hypothetical protein
MDDSTRASSVDTTSLEKREAALVDKATLEQIHGKKDASTMETRETNTQSPLTISRINEKSEENPEQAETNDEQKAERFIADAEDGDIEYPKAWRLALITIGLSLAIFCMALVRRNPGPLELNNFSFWE